MTKTNQFASYHVYPYYSDFLNYEEDYQKFIDLHGKPNNYAAYLKDLHATPPKPTKNNRSFNQIKLALNKELTIPKTNKKVPFSYYETGKLKEGNGNPNSPNYDSLADYYVNEKKGIIEVRIP